MLRTLTLFRRPRSLDLLSLLGIGMPGRYRPCIKRIWSSLPYLSATGILNWVQETDSNRRPFGYEPNELPLLHPAMKWLARAVSRRRRSVISRLLYF